MGGMGYKILSQDWLRIQHFLLRFRFAWTLCWVSEVFLKEERDNREHGFLARGDRLSRHRAEAS